jgi:tetratricopeptide (TPR) repeat protein
LGQALLNKNPDRAIASYLTAIELEPDMVLAHYNLGKAWQIQGEHSAAVACFDRVIELNPEHISGYTDAGFSLMVLGQVAKAMPYFKRAIALKPDFVEAYCRLGESRRVAAVEDDELSMAIAACDRFLTALMGSSATDCITDVTDVTDVTDLRDLRDLKVKKKDGATRYLSSADRELPVAEICDNLAEIYLHLGNALTEYGGHESATAYYQKALQIQPQNAEIYWRVGNSLAQQHRFSAAIAVYRMALTIQPALPQVYFELAKLLEKQGRWERAIDYYQKVLELQLHGYGEQENWQIKSFISPDRNALEPPHAIYLSSWDWLVNAKLEAENYVEIVWKSAPEACAANTQTSQFLLKNSQWENADCTGLT